MATLKLAPNVAPSMNIGIQNGVQQQPITVANAPDPRAIMVPGGQPVTSWSGPAQSWSTPPAPQWKPYQVFGLGLHGFGSGTLRNFINSPFRIGYGISQLGGNQSAYGGDVNDGGIKRGLGNIVGGALDGPAWLVGGAEAKGGIEGGFKVLSTGAKVLKLAKAGAKAGAVYGGGQGFADTASEGASAKQIVTKTAEGAAIGAAGGAALGPAAFGATKAVTGATHAAQIIQHVVMPNAGKDEVMNKIAQHVVNSGALQADAERQAAERTQAAMGELSKAEGKAKATADIGVSPTTKLLPGPTTTAVTSHSSQVLEASARLALNYTKERNLAIRRFNGQPEKMQAAIDSIKAKYARKHDTMVKHLDSRAPRPAAVEAGKPPVETAPISAPAPKGHVVQSPLTGVTQPARLPKEVPRDLSNPTTGQRVQGQSALLEHMRNGDFPGSATQHLRVLVHDVHNQNMMRTAASRFVKDNPELAKDVYFSGQLKAINADSHAALGRAVNMHIAKTGESPNAAMAEFQHHATQLGQGLRALHEDILTPEGAISRAMKVADAKGRGALKPEHIQNLETMVNKVNSMPKGKEQDEVIAGLKTLIDNPSLWEKGANLGYGVVSLPRAIMASIDLSFGLRQGMVLGTRFPGIWARAQKVGMASAVSQKVYDAEVKRLSELTDKNGIPLLEAAKRSGIDLEAVWGRGEEIFGGGFGDSLPGIKQSSRAYGIAASHMRMEIFKRMVDKEGGLNAVNNKWNTKQLKLLGRVINTGTGRGHGGKEDGWFEKAAPFLGKTLFSARLWKSRLDLINPLYYAALRKNPAALKLAVQSTGSFGVVVGATLAAAAAAGATVETDLRSSDFGKIKVGNTRYDIMGGLQQNLVLAWREFSGEYKSSSTGQVSSLSSGKYGKATRLSVAGRTVENKLAPVIAEAIRQISGNDISGKPMTKSGRLKEASGLVIPLNVQDTYSAGKDAMDNGASLPKAAAKAAVGAALPGTFGVGVQTYGAKTADSVNKPQEIGQAQSGDKVSTADEIKAAMSGATLNVNGRQVKWNDLNKQQKLTLAQTNQDAYNYYQKEQDMNTALSPGKVYDPRLSDSTKKVLNYFDHLNPNGKTAVLQREPGAAYALAQAKYEQDKLAGKFADPAKQAEADKSLAKAQVGSTYSQSMRDSYGMTKGDLEKLLGSNAKNAAMFNDLIAYDDALYNAGLIASHKFRNKYGSITLNIGGNGSSSSSSSGSRSSGRRSSSGRARAAKKPRAVSVPHLAPKMARYVPRQRSTRTRIPRTPSVAIKKSSRGKIKVSTKKAIA